MVRKLAALGAFVFLSAGLARADVTLLLEEPFGNFGGMNPTGHAAVYLSRVCAASPVSLRLCEPGERGVVLSRYHRVGSYDWIAIPLLPYLYAVDRADQVPPSVSTSDVAVIRDRWRREHLEEIVPDAEDGGAPQGDWIQVVGAAYDRTIYAFGIETTLEKDQELIKVFNFGPNQRRFNLLSQNCADFAGKAIGFYYPRSIHRSLIADVGIMTPKQAARCLVAYSKHHRNLRFSAFVIPQVPGSVPRSSPVRSVTESLLKSKRYAVPLFSIAALHPYFGGTLALAWIEGSHFNPRKIAEDIDPIVVGTQ